MAKPGDLIRIANVTVKIAKIFYQEYYRGVWDIEFIDNYGIYRHWKQLYDGGVLISSK